MRRDNKHLIVFTSIFMFLVGMSIVKADSKRLEVTDINLIDKSGTILVDEPVITNSIVDTNITFNEQDDFVTFELILKNNDSKKKYKIDKIKDNNKNDRLSIEYEYDEDYIESGNTSSIKMKMKYTNQYVNVDTVSLNDLLVTISLVDENGRHREVGVSPATSDNILHYLVLLIIAITGLIFGIILKKNKKLCALLILIALAITPLSIFARENYEAKVKFTNIHFKGKFETYNVTIDKDNGSDIVILEREYGETLGQLPSNPEKEGYTFDGWKDGNGNPVNENTEVTGPMDVVAHYKLVQYNLTYDYDGGNATNPSKYTIESDDITLNKPRKDGYTFTGWTEGNSESLQTDVTIYHGTTGDKNYKAHYSTNQNTPYKVVHKYQKLSLNGYDEFEQNLEGPTDEEVTPALRPQDGFANPELQTIRISGSGNTVVTYVYDRETYAFNITDRTYVDDSSTDNGTYPYGTTITVKAEERSGYDFTWSDGVEDKEREFTLEGETILTPVYTAKTNTPYTVEHYKMNSDLQTYTLVEEDTQHLTGTTDTGVTPVVNTYTGYKSPSAQTVNINGDGSTKVKYYYDLEQYRFSITDRTYIDNTSTSNGTYPYGTTITVKAEEREGYDFEWSDGNTDYEREFTLEGETTLTPIYTAKTNTPYKVVHRYQKVTLDGYDDVEESFTGTTDGEITPSLRPQTGFINPELQTTTINGNGRTVVTYTYNREQYAFSITDRTHVDNTSTSDGTYPYGTTITVKADEIDGFDFAWSDGNTDYEREFVLTEETTLTPIYTAKGDTPYKVVHKYQKLNLNEYDVFEQELEGETGASITPALRPQTGFVNPELQTTTISGSGNTVVTYIYNREEYAFSITDRTHIDNTSTSDDTYPYGTVIEVKAEEIEGYDFEWSDGNTDYEREFELTEETTLTPIYTAKTNTPYKVVHKYEKINSNEYDEVEIPLTGTTDTYVTPDLRPQTGFVNPEQQRVKINGNGSTVVTYIYSREEYTFNVTDRTYITEGSTENGTYPFETLVTVTAQEREGYDFEWNDGNTNYTRIISLTEDTTLTPVYTAKTNTPYKVVHRYQKLTLDGYDDVEESFTGTTDGEVTPSLRPQTGFINPEQQRVKINGNGSTVVTYIYSREEYTFNVTDRTYITDNSTENGTYPFETLVTVTAQEREGYDFEWNDGNTNYTRIISLTEDTTLTPVYTAKTNTPYKVVHRYQKLTLDDYEDVEESFTGTTDGEITPSLRPQTGFVNPELQTTTINGNGRTVVTYTYNREQYAFSITDRTNVDSTSTSNGTYPYGTTINVKANELDGYDFEWSDGSTDYEREFVLTEETTLTPIYTAKGDTPYKVVHKYQKLNLNEYDVFEQELEGETGASITPALRPQTGFVNPELQTTTINGNGRTVVTYTYNREQYAFSITDRTNVDSTSTSNGTYPYGTTINVKANELDGYDFEWSDGSTDYEREFVLTEETTLTPIYTAKGDTPYKVVHKYQKLNLNEYDEFEQELEGETGASITPALIPQTGFVNPELQTTTISGSGNTVVTYIYNREQYRFSITDRTYIDNTSTNNGTYPYGTVVSAKAEEREGYDFEWSDGNTGYVREITLTEETTLTPIYTAKTNTPYKVVHRYQKLTLDGYDDVEESFTGTTDSEVTPSLRPQTGFINPELQTTTINGNGSTIVTYTYNREQYRFSITDRTYIENTSTSNGTYPYGTVVSAKAEEREGYDFEWSDGNTEYDREFTLTNETVLTPVYTAKTNTPYTVEHYKMDIGGHSYTLVEEDTQHLTGTTDTGVTPVVKTYTGFISPNTQTVNINGDGSTVIKYYYEREQYRLTTEDSEYISEGDKTGDYYYEEIVVLTATDRTGYTFSEWSNGVTTNPLVLTITGPVTIKPVYTDDNPDFTVSFETNGGSDIDDQIVAYNGKVTRPENPTKDNYQFDYWYTDDTYTEEFDFENTQITSDTIIYAKWVSPNYVAVMNGTYYTTIQKAVDEAPTTKTTIRVLKDVTLTSMIDLYNKNTDKDIIINFDNHTITSTSTRIIRTKSDVEIQNGIFKCSAGSGAVDVEVGAKFVMNSGRIEADGSRQALYNYGGTVEIGGTAYLSAKAQVDSNNKRGTVQSIGGTVNITGGTIVSPTGYAVSITGGTLTIGEEDGVHDTSDITIQGFINGIYTTEDIAFYDGVIKGKDAAINNESKITEFEDDFIAVKETEEIDTYTYNVLYYQSTENLPKYRVDYNANGGSVTPAYVNVIQGRSIEHLPTPIPPEGKEFVGWYTGINEGTQVNDGFTPTSDVEIFARYKFLPHTVSFNTDGGTQIASQTVEYNEYATEPDTIPFKSMYEFNGWYTDDTYTEEFDFENTNITTDTVVYAKMVYKCGSFATDSWSTITTNLENDPTYYAVGCEKEVELDMNNDGTNESYTVRLANTSTPEVCEQEGYSQTGCGPVIEFADIVTERRMRADNFNAGGWKNTELVNWLNGEFYNKLPNDLQDVIVPTYPIVSGSGKGNSSPDITDSDITKNKIYLLSYGETASTTYLDNKPLHALDFYADTVYKDPRRIKADINGENKVWWFRTADQTVIAYFTGMTADGGNGALRAEVAQGVAPVFRIGTKYTVTFIPNEGTISYNTKEVQKGKSVGTLPTPTVTEGTEFDGWYTGMTDGVKVTESYTITGNTTLYARYNTRTYTVTFDTNGGSSIDNQSVVHNNYVTKPEDPTKDGYTFDNWYTDKDYLTEFDFENTKITSETTIYARFTKEIPEYVCPDNQNIVVGDGIVCKRAETLHTELCEQNHERFNCSGAGYTLTGSKGTDEIVYGNCGTPGVLTVGDAFTCDINNDGNFDEATERFYYVSDYYNTKSLTFDNDTAVLIYYSNVTDGLPSVDEYSYYPESADSGPLTAMQELPTNWNTLPFKDSTRAILSEYRTSHNLNYIPNNVPLPTDYSYEGYSARLLTGQELMRATGLTTMNVGDDITGSIDNYNFFFERTLYASPRNMVEDYWLETPHAGHPVYVWVLDGVNRSLNYERYENTSGVRPVIELPKSSIEYGANPGHYTLYLNSNGGTLTINYEGTRAGSAIGTLPSPVPPEGKKFDGWYTGLTDGVKVTSSYVPTGNITIFARYSDLTYTVTFDTDGGSEVASQTVYPNSYVTKPTPDPTKGRFTFDGWYTDNTYTEEFDFENTVITDDITIYAHFVGDACGTFATDSWGTIVENLENDPTYYAVGCEKEIPMDMDNNGVNESYTVRLANVSSPEGCSTGQISMSACGPVIEFVDIIKMMNMRTTETNKGGWEATLVRDYLNNDFIDYLPDDLKQYIKMSYNYSGLGASDSGMYQTSSEPIYLLTYKEVGKTTSKDNSEQYTRTLDYYVTHNTNDDRIKSDLNGNEVHWWLRSAIQYTSTTYTIVTNTGRADGAHSEPNYDPFGVAPAFRIGSTTW